MYKPATIAAISFQRPKRSRDIETEGIAATDLQSSKIPKVVVNQAEAEREFLCGLEQIHSSAAVLFSYKPMVCTSRPTQSVIQSLPRLLTSLHKSEYEKLDENHAATATEQGVFEGSH